MGGFMDKEVKALTVVPCGRSPAIAVTTDTGVQTEAITSRKAPCRALGWLGAGLLVIGGLRIRLGGQRGTAQ
jgi:hypothetical protein